MEKPVVQVGKMTVPRMWELCSKTARGVVVGYLMLGLLNIYFAITDERWFSLIIGLVMPCLAYSELRRSATWTLLEQTKTTLDRLNKERHSA